MLASHPCVTLSVALVGAPVPQSLRPQAREPSSSARCEARVHLRSVLCIVPGARPSGEYAISLAPTAVAGLVVILRRHGPANTRALKRLTTEGLKIRLPSVKGRGRPSPSFRLRGCSIASQNVIGPQAKNKSLLKKLDCIGPGMPRQRSAPLYHRAGDFLAITLAQDAEVSLGGWNLDS